MDAIDLLVRQHREMAAGMKAVLDAADDRVARRLFADVADALTVHVTAEEQVFYPAVKVRRTRDIPLESLEEHVLLKQLLADLLVPGRGDRTFESGFTLLRLEAERHYAEEEKHLFPKVRKLIGAAQREALGMEMLALQRHLDRIGEPRALVTHDL